jgi:predicted kinase
MNKIILKKPALICIYGYPGSGKSYVARNLAQHIQMAHVSADRIRSELFHQPRFDTQENAITNHLMNYIAEEFLTAGVSVVFDTNSSRLSQRRYLRELAKKHSAKFLLVWIQIDMDSAFERTQIRDKRTQDNKYSEAQTKNTFDKHTANMQNPSDDEEYMVISGKHSFSSQKSTIYNKLYQLGLMGSDIVQQNIAKPGLVNLVPAHYSDPSQEFQRRNINIY